MMHGQNHIKFGSKKLHALLGIEVSIFVRKLNSVYKEKTEF